jgi:Uma2 family endonuclease
MELTLDLNKRYTYADYLTWLDDKTRELIHGFIKMMPAPRRIHADTTYNISLHLGFHVLKNKGKCKVYFAPFDVRLPQNKNLFANEEIFTVVQPDICIVCDESKLDEQGCLGEPDMVVEILSVSSNKYDMTEKSNLYEAAGVLE